MTFKYLTQKQNPNAKISTHSFPLVIEFQVALNTLNTWICSIAYIRFIYIFVYVCQLLYTVRMLKGNKNLFTDT